MIEVFVAVVGLFFGSFLNVCIYRIPREQSIAFPPSHCTTCSNKIKFYDLIPVISYFFLKGKCRYCGEKISIRYPLVELFTGIIFLGLYIKYGFTIELFKFSVLSCILIVIGMIDYDTTDVYFNVSLTGIIFGVLFLVYNLFTGGNILTYVLGALLGGGIVALIILVSGGMGWGDFEICLLCGLFLGFKETIVMLFFSVVIGGMTGVLLIITKKKTRKDYIPFGPFIVIGSFIAMLFSEEILRFYFQFL